MSLKYSLDPAGGFLRVVADGVITADDLASHVAAIHDDQTAAGTLQSIIDLRHAQSAIGYAELVIFRDYLAANLSADEPRSWALLVCSDVSYGLARMFATLSEDLPLEIEIFTDEEEAHQWLADDRRSPSDRLGAAT